MCELLFNVGYTLLILEQSLSLTSLKDVLHVHHRNTEVGSSAINSLKQRKGTVDLLPHQSHFDVAPFTNRDTAKSLVFNAGSPLMCRVL